VHDIRETNTSLTLTTSKCTLIPSLTLSHRPVYPFTPLRWEQVVCLHMDESALASAKALNHGLIARQAAAANGETLILHFDRPSNNPVHESKADLQVCMAKADERY
jgi:hypothetical protein